MFPEGGDGPRGGGSYIPGHSGLVKARFGLVSSSCRDCAKERVVFGFVFLLRACVCVSS